jgi:hypothetical protein
MNFGYNSNVRVGDSMYHVQTEDRGPAHPFQDTVVYLSGRVVYKRSTNYSEIVSASTETELVEKLRERLAQQHRAVIAELEAGTLELHGQASAPAPAPPPPKASDDGLDLVLTNPTGWYAAGQVTFEMRVSQPGTTQGVEGAEVQACIEHDRRRIPCAEVHTGGDGRATLKFAMPADVKDGTSLVVRATDGARFAQLRFRLKSKHGDKTPAPVA